MGVKVIEWKDTIPFVPSVKIGQVIKVYDGDTMTIATYLPFLNSPLYRFPVRLRGIDAPEMRGKNEDEKRAARISQKALEDLVLHKNVTLKNVETEKYGRLLAEVYVDDININNYMVDNKYAVKYDGGTKERPEEWN
jgi:endonuclease YncB( thermonuclease family)